MKRFLTTRNTPRCYRSSMTWVCRSTRTRAPRLPQVQKPSYGGLKPEVSAQFLVGGWGWHHEAGIHVLRLILSGVFERFPKLQVISGHWGEMVPFYLQRLDDAMPPAVPACPPRQPKPETTRYLPWISGNTRFRFSSMKSAERTT